MRTQNPCFLQLMLGHGNLKIDHCYLGTKRAIRANELAKIWQEMISLNWYLLGVNGLKSHPKNRVLAPLMVFF